VVEVTNQFVGNTLACTMHEGTDFHGHA